MANYSRPHICHCLNRLASVKRNTVVTVYGQRRRTGQEFVDGVLRLSGGLILLGLRNGDVFSLAALNSDFFLEWSLAVALVGGIVAPLNYRWAEKDAEPLSDLLDEVDELKARESMYKQQIKKTCDLQKAETEVDLLGDKIESLLDFLEKIYIALDHYSPSLKH